MTTTTTMQVAKERQLDWLLEEVLGGRRGAAVRTPPRTTPWLAAAVALFAVGAALGVAWLQAADERAAAQAPVETIPWHECHGADDLERLPADVSALRCFDFDDAACARLAAKAEALPQLTHLDLSGMDVDARGVSRPPQLTDTGVRALAKLTKLRWLCLAHCHAMHGDGLQALDALPQLEHLDLTHSGVRTAAIGLLPFLGNLRTLVLSHCLDFHGNALEGVAGLTKLRRLELRGCPTIAAADLLPLVALTELRWLDLRDCQGRFRGQTASGFSTGDEEPPPPPVQDGIGITDAVVAALAELPLEALLLGGSESLTDAIGESLAKMKTLRRLDLSNLPKTSGALLARIPATLEELVLDDNEQFRLADFARLPVMPRLDAMSLSGLTLEGSALPQLLAGKRLRTLALGGPMARGKDGAGTAATPPKGLADALAEQVQLVSLDLSDSAFVDRKLLATIAALPRLQRLDLTGPYARPFLDRSEALAGLTGNRTVRALGLARNRLNREALLALADLPLEELDLRGTNLPDAEVREVAKAWPGCRITLSNGAPYRVP